MPLVKSQILKLVNFTKTQKTRYLENETLFFFKLKNLLITSRVALLQKNSFAAEVTFKYS